jgi:hypothetical protein
VSHTWEYMGCSCTCLTTSVNKPYPATCYGQQRKLIDCHTLPCNTRSEEGELASDQFEALCKDWGYTKVRWVL